MSERLAGELNDSFRSFAVKRRDGWLVKHADILTMLHDMERRAHAFYASRITERLLAAPEHLSFGAQQWDPEGEEGT